MAHSEGRKTIEESMAWSDGYHEGHRVGTFWGFTTGILVGIGIVVWIVQLTGGWY